MPHENGTKSHPRSRLREDVPCKSTTPSEIERVLHNMDEDDNRAMCLAMGQPRPICKIWMKLRKCGFSLDWWDLFGICVCFFKWGGGRGGRRPTRLIDMGADENMFSVIKVLFGFGICVLLQ